MNPEDDLLRELGNLAREREAEERRRLGEEWDRLAAGELTAEEESALAERAARSPEAAEALAAFRPLGEDFHARVAGALREQRKRETAQPAVTPAPPAPAPAPPLTFRRRPARLRAAVWAAGLAAAGLAGILLTRPGPPLPFYVSELGGGDRPERAETGVPPVYAPGSRFQLVLRPATAVQGEVEVRCVIAPRPDAAARDWRPCSHAERDSSGALRVAGTVGADVPFQPGDWTLWVIVTRAGSLAGHLQPRVRSPSDAELRRMAPGAALAGPGWSALRVAEPLRFRAG
jgi:hypothetical protein